MSEEAKEEAFIVEESPEKKLGITSLADIRKKLGLTQMQVAKRMKTKSQGSVSLLEQGLTYKVSTLKEYIEALGGKLKIVAEFGDETFRLR